MKKIFYLVLPLFVLAGCFEGTDDDVVVVEPPPVFSATQTFEIGLSGMQQVPHVASAQIASAMVELDSNLMQIRATLDLSDDENVQAAHIHDGDLGFNGAVAFDFVAGSNGIYSIAETEISQQLIADLQNGEWYINVHTTDYPDGELRGQIVIR